MDATILPEYHAFPVHDTSSYRFRNGETIAKFERASQNWLFAYTTKGDWVRVNARSGKCILSQKDFDWDVVVEAQARVPHGFLTVRDLIEWLQAAPQDAIVATLGADEESHPKVRERWMAAPVETSYSDDPTRAFLGFPPGVKIIEL